LWLIMKSFPLLWHVQKFQFLTKVETISSGLLLNSLPRNDDVAELCSGKFNVAYCRDHEWKPPTKLKSRIGTFRWINTCIYGVLDIFFDIIEEEIKAYRRWLFWWYVKNKRCTMRLMVNKKYLGK
jgi:hypothetical protein